MLSSLLNSLFPVRQIVQQMNAGLTGLIPEISDIANSLIVTHSPLRHSSEVANAAIALALGLTMSEAAVDAISKCDDPVVALLALDCEQRNLTAKPLDKTLWSSHMNADGLYEEFWLLAFEANIRAWLPNSGSIDFVAEDPNFSLLKAAGISFYDATLNLPATPGAVVIPTPPSGAVGIPTAAVPPAEIIVLTDLAISG